MNKFYPSFLVTSFLALCLASLGDTRTGESAKWPEQTINLSASGELRELFVAGLRPYRFPRMENSQLEFKHKRISLIQSDGLRLPTFQTEWADVSVLNEGLLSSIVLKQSPMSLAACRAEMLHWLPFGTNPARTANELDDFLSHVKKDYRGYNYGPKAISHDFRLVWKDSNGLRFAVWFQQALLPETPLLLQMQIGWDRPERQERSLYATPIPPPPGYENVDMTAPRDFGPDNPPEDPEIERVRKAGVMPDYSTLPKEKIRSGILPPGHTTVPGQRTAAPSSLFSTWIGWIGGLALALFVFIAHLFIRSRNASK